MPDEAQIAANPNADSNFLAKQQATQDEATTNQFLARVQGMNDTDRRAELAKYGISDDEYSAAIGQQKPAAGTAARATNPGAGAGGPAAGTTPGQLEVKQQQQHQASEAAGAHVQNLETAIKVLDPIAKILTGVGAIGTNTGAMMELGVPAVTAMLGGPLLTKLQEMGGDAAKALGQKIWGKGHPIADVLATIAGGTAAGATTFGPLGAINAEEGESAAAAAAKESAPDESNTEDVVEGQDAGTAARATESPVQTSAVAEGAAGGAGEPDTSASAGAAPTASEAAPSANAGAETDEVAQAAEQAQGRVFTPEYQQAYQDALDAARRGVVSKAEQQSAAADAPMSPHEVATLEPGTTLPAEKATALINFEHDEASRIQTLASKALDEGDVDARAEALQRIDNLVSVWDPKVQGVTAETGRALGSLTAPTPTAYVKLIRAQALSKIGTPGYMSEDEVLDAFRNASTPEEAAALAKQVGNGGAESYGKNFFVNSYISSILSPNSIAKKATSDVLNILYQIPARGLGELAGYAQRGVLGTPAASTITPGETAAMIRALRNGVGDALSMGWESAKANKPLFQEGVGFGESIPSNEISGAGTRFEGTPIGSALDWYGHLISVPGRGITAVDQAAKVMHYRMEMGALAEHQGYLAALGEGRTGADFAARASDAAGEFFAKPPQWAIDAAHSRAKVETFQRELQGTLGAIDQMRQSSWIARTVIPFFKTGTNIVRMGMERTIPGSTQAYREAFAAGGRERVLTVAKNAMGDLITAGLAAEYMKGNLTGYGPRNPQVRNLWLKDNQPYSIKVGDKWVSLAPSEPGAWVAGMVADASDMMAHLPSQDAFSVADAIGASTVREFNRQGFWEDASGLFKTVDDMSRQGVDAKGVSAGLGKLAGTMISPQAFNDLAHGIDPVRRQVSTFMDGVRNRIPYLTESGIPTRDPWGKPVVVPPGMLMNEFPAFKAVQASDDPVNKEFVRLYNSIGYAPPAIPKSMGGPSSPDSPMAIQNFRDGVNLTPAQQDEWARLRGEIKNPITGLDLKQAVTKMMGSDRYSTQDSDQERAQMLNRIFTSYREGARKQMLREHQEIRNSIAYRRAARRAAMTTPGPEVDVSGGGEEAAGGLEGP